MVQITVVVVIVVVVVVVVAVVNLKMTDANSWYQKSLILYSLRPIIKNIYNAVY